MNFSNFDIQEIMPKIQNRINILNSFLMKNIIVQVERMTENKLSEPTYLP